MGAPVTLLKAQFLAALERSERQKNSIELLIQAWRKYGILPYIDLNEWSSHGPNVRVKTQVQSELIYGLGEDDDGAFLYEKTLSETTEPHAGRMLDVQSQQFKALTAAASEKFFATIEYAQNSDSSAFNVAGEEARSHEEVAAISLRAVEAELETYAAGSDRETASIVTDYFFHGVIPERTAEDEEGRQTLSDCE